MENFIKYFDIGFKLFLAGIAAWSTYLFGYRKQQNDDIKLVADLVSSEKPFQRIVGVKLSEAYVLEGRIPTEVYTAMIGAVNQQGDRKVQEVANSSAAQVSQANQAVKQQVERSIESLPLRIYFHVATKEDKAKAELLDTIIEGRDSQIGRVIAIPPTEIVSDYTGPSELRCFRKVECAEIAPRLMALLRPHSPDIALRDLSARYENATSIRPFHFEAWFARGKPQPVQQ